jgi:hypothetical protein
LRSSTLTTTTPHENLVDGAAGMQDLRFSPWMHCTCGAARPERLIVLINIAILIEYLYQ